MHSRILPMAMSFLRHAGSALALAGALVLTGCGSGGGNGGGANGGGPADPGSVHPKILEVVPASAPVNARIELRGIGLGSTGSVTIGGRQALFVTWDDTKVATWVPDGAASGAIELVTSHGPVTDNRLFTISNGGPTLLSFSPLAGAVHSAVTLYGARLAGTTRVSIGGVDAPVLGSEADTVRTSVPPGAVTGKVEVTTGSGQASAPGEFTVRTGTVPEEITLFDPPKGPVGTKVVLTGTGLANMVTVQFGGVTAPHTVVNDTRIETAVPAGAASGYITLFNHQGQTIRSQVDFRVTANSLPHPVIHSIKPEAGPGDTRVEVLGTGFDPVDKASMGNKEIHFYRWSDTKLIVWIPAKEAISAPITLSSPAGTAHSPKVFKVIHGAPEITDFLPAKARPGTPVIIRGRLFNDLESVQFGSTAAAAPLKASATELRVLVPEGAASGPIRVKTLGGSASSRESFTVAPPGFANRVSVGVEAAYITQAVQRLDGSVPLVAGRDGLLRVFLQANLGNASTPTVQASIFDPRGKPVLIEPVPAPARSGVPTELREYTLDESWNLPIPGSALEPGNTLLVEVAPDPSDPTMDLPVRTFPADGAPRTLDIRPVPPLRITLFPVRSGGVDGNVDQDGRTAESWLTRIRQFYPVKDVDVKVGPVFTAPVPMGDDFEGYVELRDALEGKRLLEDRKSLRYWYGVFRLPVFSSVTGLGMFGVRGENKNRSAIGWDGNGAPEGQNCFSTFAHELGHTFGRYHAPCGIRDTGDLDFKYPNGGIGVYGLDVPAANVKDPGTYSDFMGYCFPRWVSDYTYEAVMDFRAWELKADTGQQAAAAPDGAAGPSLLVWGSINEGMVNWRPSFTSDQPADPPEPGDYTLECLDVHGRPLMPPLPFAADSVPDLPTRRDYRSFVFLVPMTPAMQAAPFTLHVRKGGHRLPEAGHFQSGAGARRIGPPQEPVARQTRPGVVSLDWDHGTHPGVLVKDPRTQEILAITRQSPVELETGAPELECVFSIAPTPAGETSVTRTVRVER